MNKPQEKSVGMTTQNEEQSILGAIETLSRRLENMEKFVSRRFDEIGAEIYATTQQVDMAEEGITRRFTEVLEVLSAISHSGDGNTPANAGVELDAVVNMTEDAANRILDAAGRISNAITAENKWNDTEGRQAIIDGITADVDEIFMACSFQDITGQRIRRTLENLKLIEDRLSVALDKLGIKISVADNNPQLVKASSQAEVDAMFGGAKN